MSSIQRFHPITLPSGRFVIVETIYNGEETVDRERFTKAHLAAYAHTETGFKGGMSVTYEDQVYTSMHDPVHYCGAGESIAEMERRAYVARDRSQLVAQALLDAAFPATASLPFHPDGSRWLAPREMDRTKDIAGLSNYR